MDMAFNKEFQLAVMIIMAIVIGKLITLMVDVGFKKAVSTDYITKADCIVCKNQLAERRSESSIQIRMIKGLLLVMAVKIGVSEDQLKDLIDGGG